MGYWFPPSPKVFDPVARPLGQLVVSGMHVPDTLDYPLLVQIGKSALGKSIGALKAYDLLFRVGPPPTANEVYTHGETLGREKFPLKRWCYGDLPDGGLPPDTSNPDGSTTSHYWDLADGRVPYRKCVTRGMVGTQNYQLVSVWYPDKGWDDEGFDLEREAVTHFLDIMQVVVVIVRMVASATGVGAVGSAMLGVVFDMWKMGMSQVQIKGWEPPPEPISADQVFMTLGADYIGLAAAVGATDTFGQLANEAHKSFTSLMTSAGSYPIFKGIVDAGGAIGKSAEHTAKYLDGLTQIAASVGVKGIKVDPNDVMRFAGEILGGNRGAVPVIVSPKLPQEKENDPTSLDPNDYRARAWQAACLSFASPDDALRIRRNLILDYRIRSTITSPSEQSAAARGIEESGETALDVGNAHDQYLSQIMASKISREQTAYSPERMTSKFIVQGVPTPKAKEDLDRIVWGLSHRYGKV